jgi:hypothetical protein
MNASAELASQKSPLQAGFFMGSAPRAQGSKRRPEQANRNQAASALIAAFSRLL